MLFKFKISDALKLEKHAYENPNPSFSEPGFILAVDHGVYLISNGLREEGKTPKELNLVVYAEGCNPETNEDWYDNIEKLRVGTGKGDDFAEMISCKWLDMVLEKDEDEEFLMLEITKDQIILILEHEGEGY